VKRVRYIPNRWGTRRSDGEVVLDRYESDGLFCPQCGVRDVWEDVGCDDYYQGTEFTCLACGCRFDGGVKPPDSGAAHVLDALRAAKDEAE